VTEAGGAGATVTPRTTNYGYDANSNQSTVKDARGYTTTTNYNADNQKALVTDPDGNATLTCYDGAGNVAQTVPPTGVGGGRPPARPPIPPGTATAWRQTPPPRRSMRSASERSRQPRLRPASPGTRPTATPTTATVTCSRPPRRPPPTAARARSRSTPIPPLASSPPRPPGMARPVPRRSAIATTPMGTRPRSSTRTGTPPGPLRVRRRRRGW
jgi:YD repeat-containing protein